MTARLRLLSLFAVLAVLAACQDTTTAFTEISEAPPAATDEQAATGTTGATGSETAAAGAPAISDSQDFEAVTSRLTPEEDAARLKALRERGVEVVQPEPLPERPKATASVVEYALKTTNRVGEVLYRRTNPMRDVLSRRACRKYTSDDAAQAAFLELGGPERDPRYLDPDGDGFACGWNPETYRKLVAE